MPEIKRGLKFQFQYGAIISDIFKAIDNAKTPFQFQYGAIIRRIFTNVRSVMFSVSIPIWCDYKSHS